jgi:hypothetical protein
MSTETVVATAVVDGGQDSNPKGRSLWNDGYHRLKKDKMAVVCFWIIVFYSVVAILAKLEWIASPWNEAVGPAYMPPQLNSWKQFL